jgi:phosphoenolpyruvate-protein kinase (PTS system EI component)
MAADRTNSAVASLAAGLQPALLRLIAAIIRGGHSADREVGLCGELAGEPAAIPILLGLGLDDFSMSPRAVPIAKQILRGLTVPEAEEIASAALQMGSADEVLAMVHERVPATRVA